MSPDEAEFRRIYEEAFPMVYRVAYRFSGHRELAEDAAQEAFSRAFERWGRLRGRPWIVGWIVNTTLNTLRRTARRTREVLDSPHEQESPQVDVEGAVDLWQAIRELPRRQAQAVVLYYIVDLPVAQVAEIMGCREGTAKAHLDRGRRSLARLLEPLNAGYEE